MQYINILEPLWAFININADNLKETLTCGNEKTAIAAPATLANRWV